MLDVGFTEILLIAVVSLVVLGPEKLPMAIKTLAMWIGKAKRTINGIQSEISEELRLDELKKTTAEVKTQIEKQVEDIKTPFIDVVDETERAVVNEEQQNNKEVVGVEEVNTHQTVQEPNEINNLNKNPS